MSSLFAPSMHLERFSPTWASDMPSSWLVPRFIAAAEVACGEFFNPVIPEVLAEQLRALG